MPYLPPGSSQPQPIPQARQRTVISPPPPPSSEPAPPPIDDIPTPRASDIYPTPKSEHNPAMPTSSSSPHHSSSPAPIPVPRTRVTSPEDMLSSALAATSLDSATSAVSAGTSSSPPSLCDSQGHPSPAATSVRSLPSDREDRGGAGGVDEEEEEDGIKVAGERDAGSASPDVDVEAAKAAVREPPGEKDAVSLYSEAIYAYTHTLYIQAKLSSSRTERRKQASQYAPKPSGMEKMAAKKALARRLNG
ncbi:hypothetical protein IAT38_003699 [Cryptococcus sp. DSM 104549]